MYIPWRLVFGRFLGTWDAGWIVDYSYRQKVRVFIQIYIRLNVNENQPVIAKVGESHNSHRRQLSDPVTEFTI